MLKIQSMNVHPDTKEELLPDFHEEFPYIMTTPIFSSIEKNLFRWHWHNALELFYIKEGSLKYNTPSGTFLFTEGCGGLVNSNILHTSQTISDPEHTIQYLHLFDPSLLAGQTGNLIDQKYISLFTMHSDHDILIFDSKNPSDQLVLKKIRESFSLSPDMFGFELKIRNLLSDIWLDLLEKFRNCKQPSSTSTKRDDRIKQMFSFIFQHFSEPISIKEIAQSGFCSERECYRLFKQCLHMTPNEYLNNYRLQKACDKLQKSHDSITDIGHSCGFTNSSYFGRIFKEHLGCTPSTYRKQIYKQ